MIKDLLIKYLRNAADSIESNDCELTEDQIEEILRLIAHQPLSKEQACIKLNMSRSTFDSKVHSGELPKGKKRQGFKELVWYQDELEEIIFKSKQ